MKFVKDAIVSIDTIASKESKGSVARHISRAAARLFARHGYDATSVRMIVEAAGVTKPTLYYHFGSKEGLAHALLTKPLVELAAVLRSFSGPGVDPVEALSLLIEAHFAFCREDPDRARFVYAVNFGPLATELANVTSELCVGLETALRDAVKNLADRGRIDPDRVSAMTSACQGIIIVSTIDYLYKQGDFGPGLASRIVDDLLVGFGRSGRKSSPEEIVS